MTSSSYVIQYVILKQDVISFRFNFSTPFVRKSLFEFRESSNPDKIFTTLVTVDRTFSIRRDQREDKR